MMLLWNKIINESIFKFTKDTSKLLLKLIIDWEINILMV